MRWALIASRAIWIWSTASVTAASKRCWMSSDPVTWSSDEAPSTMSSVVDVEALVAGHHQVREHALLVGEMDLGGPQAAGRPPDLDLQLVQTHHRPVVLLGQQLDAIVERLHLVADLLELRLLLVQLGVGGGWASVGKRRADREQDGDPGNPEQPRQRA